MVNAIKGILITWLVRSKNCPLKYTVHSLWSDLWGNEQPGEAQNAYYIQFLVLLVILAPDKL